MDDYTDGYGEDPDYQWEEHGDREHRVYGAEKREDSEARREEHERQTAKARKGRKDGKTRQKKAITGTAEKFRARDKLENPQEAANTEYSLHYRQSQNGPDTSYHSSASEPRHHITADIYRQQEGLQTRQTFHHIGNDLMQVPLDGGSHLQQYQAFPPVATFNPNGAGTIHYQQMRDENDQIIDNGLAVVTGVDEVEWKGKYLY
ncbi:hypothetical protein GLAREA_02139 [Glarea lozoyensis ATCC 20868]|uniref:Uncharacterized protein n=1 Tax=Glarea lozoyensis (strain ATCC 20868 / MF5171) TaxID=1116229 RepID=S3CIB5_GLAL2|nr:uncharacterized protein GLAREA_02139 [Glarea lozoyensis ATCC 20868]EPE26227.1 hypothetical protein GLAREA_02139 [Glarea lozoyensis ATCC 20868]